MAIPESPLYVVSADAYRPPSGLEIRDWAVTSSTRLDPEGRSGGPIAASNGVYFVLLDSGLRRVADFAFWEMHVLGAAPLANESWLVLGHAHKDGSLWTAVVNRDGGVEVPTQLPNGVTVPMGLDVWCDMTATAPRVWAAVYAAENRWTAEDPKPRLLLTWNAEGRFRGTSSLTTAQRLLTGQGDHLYLIERLRGRRRLVQRHAASLAGIRSWGLPAEDWRVDAHSLSSSAGRTGGR